MIPCDRLACTSCDLCWVRQHGQVKEPYLPWLDAQEVWGGASILAVFRQNVAVNLNRQLFHIWSRCLGDHHTQNTVYSRENGINLLSRRFPASVETQWLPQLVACLDAPRTRANQIRWGGGSGRKAVVVREMTCFEIANVPILVTPSASVQNACALCTASD